MYMRLLTLRLKPQGSDRLREFYGLRVLPTLQKTAGCLYATLTESAGDPNEFISLTLWDSREHLEAYQQGETFKQLIGESEVFLSDATEWRVQLSEELTLDYTEVREEPKVASFSLHAAMEKEKLSETPEVVSCLRLFRFKVRADRLEEVKQRYAENTIPTLKSVEGCRYACLMGNLGANDELVSVTIWDKKESADQYERSKVFQSMLKNMARVVPALRWKMELESPLAGRVYASGDVSVSSYAVVAGQSFQPGSSET